MLFLKELMLGASMMVAPVAKMDGDIVQDFNKVVEAAMPKVIEVIQENLPGILPDKSFFKLNEEGTDFNKSDKLSFSAGYHFAFSPLSEVEHVLSSDVAFIVSKDRKKKEQYLDASIDFGFGMQLKDFLKLFSTLMDKEITAKVDASNDESEEAKKKEEEFRKAVKKLEKTTDVFTTLLVFQEIQKKGVSFYEHFEDLLKRDLIASFQFSTPTADGFVISNKNDVDLVPSNEHDQDKFELFLPQGAFKIQLSSQTDQKIGLKVKSTISDRVADGWDFRFSTILKLISDEVERISATDVNDEYEFEMLVEKLGPLYSLPLSFIL